MFLLKSARARPGAAAHLRRAFVPGSCWALQAGAALSQAPGSAGRELLPHPTPPPTPRQARCPQPTLPPGPDPRKPAPLGPTPLLFWKCPQDRRPDSLSPSGRAPYSVQTCQARQSCVSKPLGGKHLAHKTPAGNRNHQRGADGLRRRLELGLLRARPAPASQALPRWARTFPGASRRTPPLSLSP